MNSKTREEKNLIVKLGEYQSFLMRIQQVAKDLNCQEISDQIKYFFNSEYGLSAEGITKQPPFEERDCHYNCSSSIINCWKAKEKYCPIYRCLIEKELLKSKKLNTNIIREIIALKEKVEKHARLLKVLFDKI